MLKSVITLLNVQSGLFFSRKLQENISNISGQVQIFFHLDIFPTASHSFRPAMLSCALTVGLDRVMWNVDLN